MAPDSHDDDHFADPSIRGEDSGAGELIGLVALVAFLILGGLGMWFMPSPSDIAARHAATLEARL
jgi:hypothetical protein